MDLSSASQISTALSPSSGVTSVGGRPAAIDDPLIVIGGFESPAAVETYEARCLRHHEIAPARTARGVVADEG